MTRKPVTVTDDQKQLIDTAIDIGLYRSRSALLRTAFREYFAENEVLLAVLLTEMDDMDVQDVITAVDADPESIAEILDELDVTVEWTPTMSVIDEITEDFTPPETDDSA